MKKCKIYSTAKKAEAEAIIIDGHVLLPAPRRDDIEPAHISDGQCYYPPIYAATFAEGMNFGLMPFAVECEWGEFSDEDNSMRSWFEYYSGDDFKIKCGYCDTKTGRICIAPEMEYCGDFNKYGAAIFGYLAESDYDSDFYKDVPPETIEKWKRVRGGVYSGIIDTEGEIAGSGYVGIEESHHGVYFVYQTADGWGAVDKDGDYVLEQIYDGISWDGMGGFTITNIARDDAKTKTYGIISDKHSGYISSCVTKGLTEEPTIVYDFPADYRRKNLSWDEHFHSERFRLTKKGDKFGLIRDVLRHQNDPLYTHTEEILEPLYDYEDIPSAAYKSWLEAEIRYYAKVMSKEPQLTGISWDDVPDDIRENVRAYMKKYNIKEHNEAFDPSYRPYKQGDIVLVDCGLLNIGLKAVLVIDVKNNEYSTENLTCVFMTNDGELDFGHFNLNRFYDRLSKEFAIYRSTKADDNELNELKEEDLPLVVISKALKANPELGGAIYNYLYKGTWGTSRNVAWEELKDEFGL